MSLKGADEVMRKLEQLAKGILAEGGRAIVPMGKEIMAESKSRTPVLTGALRDSHRLSDPRIERGSVSIVIGVGDSSTPYALAVHEDVENNANSKFLQSSALDAVPRAAKNIGKRISLARAMR